MAYTSNEISTFPITLLNRRAAHITEAYNFDKRIVFQQHCGLPYYSSGFVSITNSRNNKRKSAMGFPIPFFFFFLSAVASQHPQSLKDEKNLDQLTLEGRFKESLQTSGNNCRSEL